MKNLYLDIGSTYFKLGYEDKTEQFFRDFDIDIYEDLKNKCGSLLDRYDREHIYICSSANGGLSTLIIGLASLFSLRPLNIGYKYRFLKFLGINLLYWN